MVVRSSLLYPNVMWVSIASAVLLLGCSGPQNRVRHRVQMSYAGDALGAVDFIAQEITAKGYKAVARPREFAKFKYDEHTVIHYKAKPGRMDLVVALKNIKDRSQQEIQQMFEVGEKIGKEIWEAAQGRFDQARQAEVAQQAAVAEAAEQARLKAEQAAQAQAADQAQAETQAQAQASAAGEEGSADADAPKTEKKKKRKWLKVMGKVTQTTMKVNNQVNQAGGATGGSSQTYCCVNKKYYHCGSKSAFDRCAGDLARCTAKCKLGDGDCYESCMRSYPPDPSDCDAQPDNDGKCQR